jgi:ABC-type multidrug transport system fused ATPase/permease subunit
VVLDEPTSALDAKTERMLLDALERLMKGRVTFIIAHRLSTIRHADEILVVLDGEVVERGSHAVLMDLSEGVYGGLYRQQMEIVDHDGPVEIGVTNGNGHPSARSRWRRLVGR